MVMEHVQLGNILHDIRHWMSLLPECSLENVNRERNMAADTLSKHAMEYSNYVSLFCIPPLWLIKYLYWPYKV